MAIPATPLTSDIPIELSGGAGSYMAFLLMASTLEIATSATSTEVNFIFLKFVKY